MNYRSVKFVVNLYYYVGVILPSNLFCKSTCVRKGRKVMICGIMFDIRLWKKGKIVQRLWKTKKGDKSRQDTWLLCKDKSNI